MYEMEVHMDKFLEIKIPDSFTVSILKSSITAFFYNNVQNKTTVLCGHCSENEKFIFPGDFTKEIRLALEME